MISLTSCRYGIEETPHHGERHYKLLCCHSALLLLLLAPPALTYLLSPQNLGTSLLLSCSLLLSAVVRRLMGGAGLEEDTVGEMLASTYLHGMICRGRQRRVHSFTPLGQCLHR